MAGPRAPARITARHGPPGAGVGARSSRLRRRMWTSAHDFEDIRYETSGDGIAKITIDRPEGRNPFRRRAVIEMSWPFELAREYPDVGVIILTGEGDKAFCSGGAQRVRGDQGYEE